MRIGRLEAPFSTGDSEDPEAGISIALNLDRKHENPRHVPVDPAPLPQVWYLNSFPTLTRIPAMRKGGDSKAPGRADSGRCWRNRSKEGWRCGNSGPAPWGCGGLGEGV